MGIKTKEPYQNVREVVLPERGVFSAVGGEWRLVGAFALLLFAASILYTYLSKPVWEAKATILFPPRAGVMPSFGGDGASSSLAASLLGAPTPLRMFAGILESERTRSYVAREAGISRKRVKQMRDITDQSTESTLTISAKDKDPKLAERVVRLHLQALANINESVTGPLFDSDLGVLRSELAKQRERVRNAEARLLAFQKDSITGASLAVGGESKQDVIPVAGTWLQQLRQLEIKLTGVETSLRTAQARTKRLAKMPSDIPTDLPPFQKWRDKLSELEYKLQVAQLTLAPSAPEIVNLKKEIGITREKLHEEVQRYVKGVEMETLDPTGTVPSDKEGSEMTSVPRLLTERLALEAQVSAVGRLAALAPAESVELSRLMRDLVVKAGILNQLEAQTQLAEVQAARSPNRWEVLDEPQVDEDPVNKSYARNGIIGIMLGLVLGTLVALVRTDRRSRGSLPIG